jgi:NAD(P)-dependent dehydrogenase (short-subunit alcohol dehydrogenase family)
VRRRKKISHIDFECEVLARRRFNLLELINPGEEIPMKNLVNRLLQRDYTAQYPRDYHHTRRRESMKSHTVTISMFQELAKSLQSAKGKLYAVRCDASKESDVQAAFKWVKDNLGGVDILVNNAAVAYNTSLIGKSPKRL